MVRFLFDNIVVDDPINWDGLQSKLKRGDTINALLMTVDGRFDFPGTGYEYIANLANTDDFCRIIDVSIQYKCYDDWEQLFIGTILVADCVFNEKNCSVNVEILDRSFFAKIDNNKNIKTCIDAGRSKNGNVITIPTPYLVDWTNLSNPLVFPRTNVPCIRVYDAFEYMISFMSDGALPFASSLFDIGGDWEGLAITTGERLRLTNSSQFTEFSFLTLWQEINKRIPIVLVVDNPFTSPLIRIEERGYLDGDSVIIELNDIYEIASSYDTDKLYSVIKFGSPTFDAAQYYIPDALTFYGHKVEEFGFLGQCNKDEALDLQCDWIVSTSVMVQIYGNNDQSFDNDIILIDTDLTDSTNGVTKYENYLNVSPASYWYNARLTNDKISERQFGNIPNSFAAYFEPVGTGTFQAFNGALATVVGIAVNPSFNFTNVSFNIGSYYNSFDTFVSGQLGVYDFEILFDLNVLSTPKTIRFHMDIFDDANVYRGSRPFSNYFSTTGLPTGNSILTATAQQTLPAGWYVVVRVIWGGAGTVEINTSSYWTCNNNSIAGGTYQTIDSSDFAVRVFDFEYPLTQTEWRSIVDNPTSMIKFAMNGQEARQGWVKELIYDHVKGTGKFRLLTSKATIDVT